MTTGNRRLRINTQERAMSSDINRLQTFAQQDQAELFRGLLNTYVTSDDNDLTEVAPSTVEAPLRAEIIHGLMVKPQAGVFDLFVDPGLLFALAPDASPDESNYKYIREDGIAVGGTLVMTANASGLTRIDVVECSINPVENIVTDSRDIFDANTGLFAAATITKELRGRLLFRVRAGVAGSGFPGVVSGWLPLTVASVPNGTTTNNTITFWDVRPVIKDREFGIAGTGAPDAGRAPETSGFLQSTVGPALSTLTGHTLTSLNGRKLGGRLRRGTPGTDADNIILTDAANLEPGFVSTLYGFAYLYLVTPFGLPRWARYTDGPAGRVPRSPRGIPVLSSLVPPSTFTSKPTVAISLPTSTGLGGSTTAGICIAMAVMRGSNAFYSCGYNGRSVSLENSPTQVTAVAATGGYMKWTIPANACHPANAKGMWVSMAFSRTLAAGTIDDFDLNFLVFPGAFSATGPSIFVGHARFQFGNPTAGSITLTDRRTTWLPLPQSYPGAAAASFDIGMYFNGSTTFAAGPNLLFLGYTY